MLPVESVAPALGRAVQALVQVDLPDAGHLVRAEHPDPGAHRAHRVDLARGEARPEAAAQDERVRAGEVLGQVSKATLNYSQLNDKK